MKLFSRDSLNNSKNHLSLPQSFDSLLRLLPQNVFIFILQVNTFWIWEKSFQTLFLGFFLISFRNHFWRISKESCNFALCYCRCWCFGLGWVSTLSRFPQSSGASAWICCLCFPRGEPSIGCILTRIREGLEALTLPF